MATNSGIKAFVCGADLKADRRVVLQADNTINYAGADDVGIGVIMDDGKTGDFGAVKLFNVSGTFDMVASEAINPSQIVYAAAEGKVSGLPVAAGTYVTIGVAMDGAAVDDGDAFEVLPQELGKTVTVSE